MSELRPTEAVNESTRDLDRRGVGEILAAIHAEDRSAWAAVGEQMPALERAVDVLVGVLRDGGRWFNAGAGTSGRVGALDASEVPPTFGLPAERVQAIIAGGPSALSHAVEGAEDDALAGARELRERFLGPRDAVVALSASGATPYTLGCLEAARAAGARSIAVTCVADSPLAQAAEVSIAPAVGPEVIAGSTRMKGGLAQKMVMHLLSTTVMVRLGFVSGNRMTHVRPASDKLRARAARMVEELAGVDAATARRLLEATQGDAHQAIALAARHRA